jgi:DNA-directed RNA polymerase subunit RPC12/RpoP
MSYIRCTQCGSKALVAASQCPKCTQPFNTLDARGERAKLKKCRSCGIMHRVDSTCHWCGDVKRSVSLPAVSPVLMRSAAAVAVVLTASIGVWQYAPPLRKVASASPGTTANRLPATGVTREAMRAGENVTDSATGSTTVSSVSGVLAADSVARLITTAPSGVASAVDSIAWTPVVARTWVNVRSDASRNGQVVGVIKPSSRAMLGTDRAGWRQVRSPDVSGWVDPRHFAADSLRTRGE